jgi:hypothetical protein
MEPGPALGEPDGSRDVAGLRTPPPAIDAATLPRPGVLDRSRDVTQEAAPRWAADRDFRKEFARARRAYGISRLPILQTDWPDPGDARRDLLLRLYTEVCSNWRALVDVRFKLLALVPTVSVAALVLVLAPSSNDKPGYTPAAVALIAGVALVATAGLWVYDTRNSQLHDELISRARRIEYELGIATGQFKGRPGTHRWPEWIGPPGWLSLPWLSPGWRHLPGLRLLRWLYLCWLRLLPWLRQGSLTIQHDAATRLIYRAAVGGWIVALIGSFLGWYGAPTAAAPRTPGAAPALTPTVTVTITAMPSPRPGATTTPPPSGRTP